MSGDRHLGVWMDDDDAGRVWTDYPPPAGFAGHEEGVYGDRGYVRELSADEAAVYRRRVDAEIAALCAVGEAQRQTYFYEKQTGTRDDEPAEEAAAGDPG